MTHLASRIPAGAAVFALLVASIVTFASSDRTAEANHPGMAAMSIDANISGNDADTLGPNNSCVSTVAGGTLTVDVTALGIPPSQPMIGYAFGLNYDASFFTVTNFNANLLLAVLPGSQVFVATDPPPDADGIYDAGVADINVSAAEYGSGVLERITFGIDPSTPNGTYDLTLTYGAHIVNAQNHTHPAATYQDAVVRVGEACPTGVGDVDCSATVNSIDALKILRHNAGLSVSQNEPPPCPNLDTDTGSGRKQGDVDCDGVVSAIDALKVLRATAGLPVTQQPGCPSVV